MGTRGKILNILEVSKWTDRSNLGLFSAPPSRTIGNRPPELLAKGAETSITGFPSLADADQRSLNVRYSSLESVHDPPTRGRRAPPTPRRPSGRPPGPRMGLLWLVLRSRAGPGCRGRSSPARPVSSAHVPRPSSASSIRLDSSTPRPPGRREPRAPGSKVRLGSVSRRPPVPDGRGPDPSLAVLEQAANQRSGTCQARLLRCWQRDLRAARSGQLRRLVGRPDRRRLRGHERVRHLVRDARAAERDQRPASVRRDTVRQRAEQGHVPAPARPGRMLPLGTHGQPRGRGPARGAPRPTSRLAGRTWPASTYAAHSARSRGGNAANGW